MPFSMLDLNVKGTRDGIMIFTPHLISVTTHNVVKL